MPPHLVLHSSKVQACLCSSPVICLEEHHPGEYRGDVAEALHAPDMCSSVTLTLQTPRQASVQVAVILLHTPTGGSHPHPHMCKWQSSSSTHLQVAVILLHTPTGGSHPPLHTCRWQSSSSTHLQVGVILLHIRAGDSHPSLLLALLP